jgi:hypothetical protein
MKKPLIAFQHCFEIQLAPLQPDLAAPSPALLDVVVGAYTRPLFGST